jgi:DivIVA domain-containing protein
MGTALIYLVVVLGVAAAFFLAASAIFGRGEELAPLPGPSTPTRLPEPAEVVGGHDVRGLRFQQAVRGYKMAEVDWALERLAAELDRSHAELDQTRRDLTQARVELSQAHAELDRVRAELTDARGRVAQLESAAQAGGGAG